MGNKKKQTNEFDNYFDDDFEVVYEDLEDLGSYLSEDSSDNNNDYDDYDGYDGDTDYYDDYDDDDDYDDYNDYDDDEEDYDDDYYDMTITATAEIQKRKSATTNRIRIPKNPRRKSVADCPM